MYNIFCVKTVFSTAQECENEATKKNPGSTPEQRGRLQLRRKANPGRAAADAPDWRTRHGARDRAGPVPAGQVREDASLPAGR